MLMQKLLAATGESKLYSDDVFQAFTRNGAGADVVVTTGIDMTKGYMLWSKGRSGATDHAIYDSARGVTMDLVSNTTAAQTTQTTGLKAVSATGHTVGSLAKMNTSAATYVDFVFRKAPKFFDCGTFVAGSATNRRISHSLSVAPGMVVLKRTDNAQAWMVYHRSLGTSYYLTLNTPGLATSSANCWGSTDPTAYDFGVNEAQLCTPGGTYVWYAFAHDTGTDGLIQCGSFTTDGSGNATVNLGWEPQYLMFKSSSSSARSWDIVDSMRGFTDSAITRLFANLSNTEGVGAGKHVTPTATGFQINSLDASTTMIYLAIRRPNKPPTTGTQVYNAIARTGTGAAASVTGVGFAPDLLVSECRSNAVGAAWWDRLRGASRDLKSYGGTAEVNDATTMTSFGMDGFVAATDSSQEVINNTSWSYINHFFKRAPGVFDVVCYTGTGSAHSEAHSLGVAPELMIVKRRSTSRDWCVYSSSVGASKYLALNLSYSTTSDATIWSGVAPTSSVFSVGNAESNNAGDTYVAYLFATKPGISKCGSFVGNGGTQTIDCGFTTGARFVLIKSTSTTGNWTVLDSTRGIVAGSDPYLALNSTAAEVTGEDCIDPASSGFIVNSTTAALNTNGVSYLYLSLA